jgi:hypothetical protein
MVSIEFLTQPWVRVGDLLGDAVAQNGRPRELVLVSAFASLATVLRFKHMVTDVVTSGGAARMVIGVDLGGTSKEVLQEVATWGIPVTIIKNRMPGVTFHPKIYLLRWSELAHIIVGSNNLTEGGLYKNYEAAIRLIYDLPADDAPYLQATEGLRCFVEPRGPTAALLTPEYLISLLALSSIPSEAQARRLRGERSFLPNAERDTGDVFGFQSVEPPPPLPPELQRILLVARAQQRGDWTRQRNRIQRQIRAAVTRGVPASTLPPLPRELPPVLAQLDPSAFYMTLPAMKADNPRIPGEPRIPLEALEMAEEFWGWPDNYVRRESPRAGQAALEQRVYHDWRARWHVWPSDDPSQTADEDVRMYMYENSSDFRLYVPALNRLSAAAGDIIRVTRVTDGEADFECIIARTGTTDFNAWQTYLVNPIRGSNRRFGYT